MDRSFSVDGFWQIIPAISLALFGLQLLWRGLRGGPAGERGLLRQGIDMLSRLEGFRLTLLGLVLVGFGAAWFWQSPVLLFLALGIGAVELLESSVVIATWKWGRRRAATNET